MSVFSFIGDAFFVCLKMVLTDTHTHIYYHEGEALTDQIRRCEEQGIQRLFLPNVDLESVGKIQTVVERFPEKCFPMLGLHPCSVQEDYKNQLRELAFIGETFKCVGIGEIGIDLYWDKTTLGWQQDAFKTQILWAKQQELPIVIHCREAFDEVFEILDEMRGDDLRGIFHCFTGSIQQAERAIDLGLYIGIGGIVTFKNAGLDKVVKSIPLQHVVLETDAPYLAPVPFRGKPNESSYLRYVAEKVAELHEVSLKKVADVTTANAVDVFKV